MARKDKVTIEGSNLQGFEFESDWGGVNNSQSTVSIYGTDVPPGKEWGMNRGEVERVQKEKMLQLSAGKVGDWLVDSGVLYGFATTADKEAWQEEPEPSLVLCSTALPTGGDTQTDALAIFSVNATQYYRQDMETYPLKFKVRNVVDGEPSTEINVSLINSAGSTIAYIARPVADEDGFYTITIQKESLRRVPNTQEAFTLKVERAGEDRYTTRTIYMFCVNIGIALSTGFNFGQVNPAQIGHVTTYTLPTGVSMSLVVEVYAPNDSLVSSSATSLTATGSGQTHATPLDWSALNQSGVYRCQAYLDMGNGMVQSQTVVTPLIHVTERDADSTAFVAVEPVVGATLYDTITPRFAVYNKGEEYSDVRLTFNNGAATLLNVMTGRVNTQYSVDVEQASNTLTVQAEDNGTPVALRTITFSATGDFDWSMADGYKYHLTGKGRSNAERPTPATWGGITVFEGCSFKDGGSRWENGALHLTGGGKATISMFPFYDTTQYDAVRNIGGGILASGRTLRIRFKVSNVGDPSATVISCWEPTSNIGFYVTGDTIFVRMGSAVITTDATTPQSGRNDRHFTPGENIELGITVQPRWDAAQGYILTDQLAKMYINGQFAGEGAISGNTLTQTEQIPLTLQSNSCDLDVYCVTLYEKCLDSFDMLKNSVMSLGSLAAMRTAFQKEQCYVGTSGEVGFNEAFQYCLWLSAQVGDKIEGTCSIIVNTYEYDPTVTDTGVEAPGIQELELFFFRNGAVDTSRTVKYSAKAAGDLRVRIQGTSTAFEFRKNMRYDGRGKNDNSKRVLEYRWSMEAYVAGGSMNPDDGWVGWDSEAATWSRTDGTTDKEQKKLAIYLRGDATTEKACTLLTVKTNYNESTATRNLPMARWIDDAMRHLATRVDGEGNPLFPTILTPPQRTDTKVRQAIDGLPAVQFTHSVGGSDYRFTGKVDLITDKKNAGVFGFQENESASHPDFSIEFRNGDTDVCNFRCPYLVTAGKYMDAQFSERGQDCLEYRWPDMDTGDTYYGDSYLRQDSALQRLFDFVFNTHPDFIGYQSKNGELSSTLGTGISILGETGYADNRANRLDKFRKEAGNYIVLDNVAFQAYVTKSLLWTDQRAKNQFYTHFAGDEIVSTYTDALNTAGQTYEILRLLPYDIDTSLRGDNASRLRFDFTRLPEDESVFNDVVARTDISETWLATQSSVVSDIAAFVADRIAGRKSALYEMIDWTCADLYAQFHAQLGDFMSLETLTRYCITEEADAYNSVIYNADTAYKYQASGSADDHIKAHGSAREDLLWWLDGRTFFMGGENGAGEFTASEIGITLAWDSALDADNREMRYDTGDIPLSISSSCRNYIGARVGASGALRKTYAPDPSQHYSVTLGVSAVASDDGARVHVFGQKFFDDIADLSRVYVAAVNSWGGCTSLKALRFGSDDEGFANPVLTNIRGSGNPVFSACEEVDLRNCTAYANSDFTWLPAMKVLRLTGCSQLRSIELPETDCLTTLTLPSGITLLVIKDKTKLTSVTLEGAATMAEIRLDNVAAAGGLSILQQVYQAQYELTEPALASLTLTGINWTGVSPEMMIWLGGIDDKTLTGRVVLSSLTMAQYRQMLALYGSSVFTPGSDFIIDYTETLIEGPSTLLNGDTGQYSAAAFPVTTSPIEYLLYSDASTLVEAQTDGQGRVYRTYGGVTLYETTGEVSVAGDITTSATVLVKARAGSSYSEAIALTAGLHSYPSAVFIDGKAKVWPANGVGEYEYTKRFDTDDFDADVESVVWSLSATGIANLMDSSATGTTLNVTGATSTSVELTITVTVTLTGGRVRTAAKTVAVRALPAGAVDLDLPSGLLWAQGNIIKDSGQYAIGGVSDYGCYFSWGNIDGYNTSEVGSGEGKYSFSQANYDASPGKSVSASIASTDITHDAAAARLGNGWHLPTSANFSELFNSAYTTHVWTTVNGISGRRVTSKSNGNSIFLPAAGIYNGSSLVYRGTFGNYWSASYGDASSAYNLYFNSSTVNPSNIYRRYYGYAVRAVQ